MLANSVSQIRWLRQHCDGGGNILNYVVFDGLYVWVVYCTQQWFNVAFTMIEVKGPKNTFYLCDFYYRFGSKMFPLAGILKIIMQVY